MASAANGTITTQGCEFVFQPGCKSAQFAQQQLEFLQYLADLLGKPFDDLKVGIVYENSAWGEESAANGRKDIEAAGLQIAVDENYEAGIFFFLRIAGRGQIYRFNGT